MTRQRAARHTKSSAGGGQKSLKALTLRLDPARFHKLELLAEAENRSPTNYVETLVLRDLEARSEDRRVITVFAAPELDGVTRAPLQRSAGESDERYAERSALFDELLAIPDAD